MKQQQVSTDEHASNQNDDVVPMVVQTENRTEQTLYDDSVLLSRLLALITVV